MNILVLYCIFALATAILALLDLYIPAMHEVRDLGVKNLLTENTKLAYLVFFCVSFVFAPFIWLPLMIPSKNARFRKTLVNSIAKD